MHRDVVNTPEQYREALPDEVYLAPSFRSSAEYSSLTTHQLGIPRSWPQRLAGSQELFPAQKNEEPD